MPSYSRSDVDAFVDPTFCLLVRFVLLLFLLETANQQPHNSYDKIVLKMYRAQEVTATEAPQLYGIVQKLAMRANLPMPKVYIVNTSMPNAFATGRDPQHAAVAATTGILDLLNAEELEGVLAHELAHVKHRDTLISAVAATVAGVITMIATWVKWGSNIWRLWWKRRQRRWKHNWIPGACYRSTSCSNCHPVCDLKIKRICSR